MAPKLWYARRMTCEIPAYLKQVKSSTLLARSITIYALIKPRRTSKKIKLNLFIKKLL